MALSNTSVAGGPTNVINSEQASLTFFGPASTSQTSQEFTVDQFPFYLSAYNLGADDVITVQQVVSHGGTKLASTYQPVFGALSLNTNTSKLVIEHPGRYQLVHSGSSSLGTFTVLGAAASSASTGFAELAAGLQAVVKGVSVTGTYPIVITGQGTQASPYVVTIPPVSISLSTGTVAVGTQSAGSAKNTFLGNTLLGYDGNTNETCIGYGCGVPPSVVSASIHDNFFAGISTPAAWGNSTVGTDNIGIGNGACTFNNAGTFTGNVCIGSSTGHSSASFSNAVAIGYHAASTFSSDGLVAVGAFSGSTPNLTKATTIGYQAGNANLTGGNLTAVGYQAGSSGGGGVTGTYFGALAGAGATFANGIVINNASGTALNTTQANQALLGDSSITQLVTAGSIIQGGVISASDKRLKMNVEAEWQALEKINRLQPVTFKWDPVQISAFNAVVDTTEIDEVQHGLLAQELELVFPTMVKTIDRGSGPYKVVRYEKLITVLIAALQDLSDKVTELEGKLHG